MWVCEGGGQGNRGSDECRAFFQCPLLGRGCEQHLLACFPLYLMLPTLCVLCCAVLCCLRASVPGAVWTDVDPARTGNLPFVFEPDMSFEKYVDYAMDVPMYFVYREGQYVNALGQSWRDFMEVGYWVFWGGWFFVSVGGGLEKGGLSAFWGGAGHGNGGAGGEGGTGEKGGI